MGVIEQRSKRANVVDEHYYSRYRKNLTKKLVRVGATLTVIIVSLYAVYALLN